MVTDSMSFEQLCELFNYLPKNRPISTDEVAEMTGLASNTLEQHRFKGTGPRFFSPPGTRRVWYSERDILAWLASGARTSTSDTPQEPKPVKEPKPLGPVQRKRQEFWAREEARKAAQQTA